MTFKKYMHIERFGTDAVEGIELGKCFVFPKLDGTNASVWCNPSEPKGDGSLVAGSRNRIISEDNDNQGFMAFLLGRGDFQGKALPIIEFFEKNPKLRLYGEWLVPHTLKTYRDDAWHRFYVFDVLNDETDQLLSYDTYKPLLDEFGVDYIPPLAIINNGSYDHFLKSVQANNFFIKEGAGIGEGVVIKNYDFYSKYGPQVWAKIVTAQFKEQNHVVMGAPTVGNTLVEELICNDYVTEHLVNKVYDKIRNEGEGWTSRCIPRLLDTVYHDLITEELWDILKVYKNPFINFKTLKALCINKIKTIKPEVF